MEAVAEVLIGFEKSAIFKIWSADEIWFFWWCASSARIFFTFQLAAHHDPSNLDNLFILAIICQTLLLGLSLSFDQLQLLLLRLDFQLQLDDFSLVFDGCFIALQLQPLELCLDVLQRLFYTFLFVSQLFQLLLDSVGGFSRLAESTQRIVKLFDLKREFSHLELEYLRCTSLT